MGTWFRRAIAGLLIVCGASGVAHAEDVHLRQGKKLFRNLEHTPALLEFQAALQNPELSSRERTAVYLYLGLCRTELLDMDGARSAFRAALELTPSATIPGRVSPKVQRIFDEEGKAVAAARLQQQQLEAARFTTVPEPSPPPPAPLPARPLSPAHLTLRLGTGAVNATGAATDSGSRLGYNGWTFNAQALELEGSPFRPLGLSFRAGREAYRLTLGDKATNAALDELDGGLYGRVDLGPVRLELRAAWLWARMLMLGRDAREPWVTFHGPSARAKVSLLLPGKILAEVAYEQRIPLFVIGASAASAFEASAAVTYPLLNREPWTGALGLEAGFLHETARAPSLSASDSRTRISLLWVTTWGTR